MAQRRFEYELGFKVNLKQVQQAIQEVNKSLSKIGDIDTGRGMTQSVKEAAIAAKELQQHLLNAINSSTGKLDLSKFSASLEASNTTLESYRLKLSSIGPEGQQAFLKVASAIAQAEAPLKRSNNLLNSLWITMKNTMRWQLTTSMLRGFMGTLQGSVRYAQDLNESLNRIQIVTKQSSEQMKEFAKSANEAASQLNTTTTNYTDAALIYYQQGSQNFFVDKS